MNPQSPNRLLDYLPAIFQVPEEDGSESFLSKLLRLFDTELAEFEQPLDRLDAYFDPAHTPFLEWLAGWVALTLDPAWDDAQQRRLVAEAVELYHWRGTAEGLKRWLGLYTGLKPEQIEIREGRRPGGFQIGVSSRIGGVPPGSPRPVRLLRRDLAEDAAHDYYVVRDYGAYPQPVRLVYWRADRVSAVTVVGQNVVLEHPDAAPTAYANASITRRNALAHHVYEVAAAQPHAAAGQAVTLRYTGDSILVEEMEDPFAFVVTIHSPPDQLEKLRGETSRQQMHAILQAEKPAHTAYALKIVPMPPAAPTVMQIGVASTIGAPDVPLA